MTCGRCGREIPDGSQFCNHCGAPNQGRIYVSPSHTIEKPAKRSNRATLTLIGLVLLLGAIAIYQVLKSPPEVRAPVGSPAPEPTLGSGGGTLTPAVSSPGSALTPAEFTIGPAGLRYFKIDIDERTASASIVGKFNATGGAYNDIEVFVIGPDPSVNPREGLYAKALYSSRRVSSHDIDVPLSSGQYYLVFSNAWSPYNKTVSATISLQSQPR